jgi:hypothetical protein
LSVFKLQNSGSNMSFRLRFCSSLENGFLVTWYRNVGKVLLLDPSGPVTKAGNHLIFKLYFLQLMGIWALVLWQQMGQPKEVNLVELGPGRGALMADLLRVSAHQIQCSFSLLESLKGVIEDTWLIGWDCFD